MIGYIAAFLAALVTAGIVSVPTDKELKYAFEKANTHDELVKIYEDSLKRKYDKDVERDYVKLLLHAKAQNAPHKAREYLKKYKDPEIMERFSDYYKQTKEPQKSEYWLIKGYEVTKDERFIEQRLSLGYMFEPFSIDCKQLSADIKSQKQLLQNKKLTEKALGYFAYKKDFASYISTANAAYEATKDASYIQKLVDIYGYTQNQKEQKKWLKLSFDATKDYKILYTLYGMGEREYAASNLEKNIANLPDDGVSLLKNIYLWSSKNDKYYEFIKKNLPLSKLTEIDLPILAKIAAEKGDIKTAADCYDELVSKTKEPKYLLDAAELMEYAGRPELSIKYYEKHYAATKNIESVERLAAVSYGLGDREGGLRYERQKVFDEKNTTAIKAFIKKEAADGFDTQALKDASTYRQITDSVESAEFFADIAAAGGDIKSAKQALKTQKPNLLSKEALSIFAGTKIEDMEDIPYLKTYYDATKDPSILTSVADFGLQNGRGYAFALLERFLGTMNGKNLRFFLDSLPIRSRKEAIESLIAESAEAEILNAIGSYALMGEDTVSAKKAFHKTLSIDRKNLTALEFAAKIESWNNNPQKALEYFLEYDGISGENPEIAYYIAELYKILQKPTYSPKYYKTAIKGLNRDDPLQNTMYLKSVSAIRSPSFVKDEFEKAVLLDDTDGLYGDYIEALYHAKKYETIEKKRLEGKNKDKRGVRILKLYAYTAVELERYKEALEFLDEARAGLERQNKQDPSIFFDYGYVYEKMDEPLLALISYNKGLRLDPNNQNGIEAKTALRNRLAGYISMGYTFFGDIPSKELKLSMPLDSVRITGSALEYYNKFQNTVNIEDLEQKRFLIGIGNGYQALKLYITPQKSAKISLEYSQNYNKDYKDAVIEALKQTDYGLRVSKEIVKNIGFEGYYFLRDYIWQNQNIATATLSDMVFRYEPLEKLSIFYENYIQNIKKQDEGVSPLGFGNYRSDTLGVIRSYDINTRLSVSAGLNLVRANEKTEWFPNIALDYNDFFHIGYSTGRDNFSGDVQKMFELTVKYKY